MGKRTETTPSPSEDPKVTALRDLTRGEMLDATGALIRAVAGAHKVVFQPFCQALSWLTESGGQGTHHR